MRYFDVPVYINKSAASLLNAVMQYIIKVYCGVLIQR